MSSRQPAGLRFQSSSSRTKRLAAPTWVTAWKIEGQIGETMTILSPVSTTHCRAVTMASVAAPGSEMRRMSTSDAQDPAGRSRTGAAQRLDAPRAAIEGAALVQGGLRRLADEGGGDQVGLAEPQRDDVRVAQAEGGDEPDAIGLSGWRWQGG